MIGDTLQSPLAKLIYGLLLCITMQVVIPFVESGSRVQAQVRDTAASTRPSRSRIDRLRRQRSALEATRREQQAREQQLLKEQESLLAQQAQLRKSISELDQEFKKALSESEYTTKKCKIKELHAKSEKVGEQVKQNQQHVSQARQELAQTDGQLGSTRQQIARIQQQASQAQQDQSQQDQDQPPQQQDQQQRSSRLDALMVQAVNPPANRPPPILAPSVAPGPSGENVIAVLTSHEQCYDPGWRQHRRFHFWRGCPYGGTAQL